MLPIASSGFHDVLQRGDQTPYHAVRLETQYRRGIETRGGETLDNDFAEPEGCRRFHERAAALMPYHLKRGLGLAIVDLPKERDFAASFREGAVLQGIIAYLAQGKAERFSRIGIQQDLWPSAHQVLFPTTGRLRPYQELERHTAPIPIGQ